MSSCECVSVCVCFISVFHFHWVLDSIYRLSAKTMANKGRKELNATWLSVNEQHRRRARLACLCSLLHYLLQQHSFGACFILIHLQFWRHSLAQRNGCHHAQQTFKNKKTGTEHRRIKKNDTCKPAAWTIELLSIYRKIRSIRLCCYAANTWAYINVGYFRMQ